MKEGERRGREIDVARCSVNIDTSNADSFTSVLDCVSLKK
jgi:hypothetical protein